MPNTTLQPTDHVCQKDGLKETLNHHVQEPESTHNHTAVHCSFDTLLQNTKLSNAAGWPTPDYYWEQSTIAPAARISTDTLITCKSGPAEPLNWYCTL